MRETGELIFGPSEPTCDHVLALGVDGDAVCVKCAETGFPLTDDYAELQRGGWISAVERKPRMLADVLVYWPDSSYAVGWWTGDAWYCLGVDESLPATHWRPLPEPPR